MATVNKNFRIKHGLVVEGSTATVNGQSILTETGGDSYILNLVGGATLVKSVDTGVFNVDGAGNLTVNAETFDSYGSASAAQAAAEATASADATSKANAAQSAAVSTAASDATSKANAAQSAAEATASADATTKADAAQAAAEATASADAKTKGEEAQAAAEATASADATTKADAAQAAAEATASADATTKADAAQAAAEATAAAANTAQQNGTTSFTAINYNDVAKQVAATTGNIATAAETTAISWAAADYRSAKFVVKAKNGVHTQVSDLVVTLDTSNNVAVSEYGITYSNGTELAAVTADYSGSDVRIRVTPANNNTEVVVVGTLIK
jgi:pyruvate/2-oxoglutarate dehydrogenase complex dihydrolipoamide acyltransferase (E2) component